MKNIITERVHIFHIIFSAVQFNIFIILLLRTRIPKRKSKL